MADKIKNEKELKESAYQFRMVIDSVRDGITFSDARGYFFVYNERMKEITGYTMEEANAGGDFATLLYPDAAARNKALERLSALADGSLHEVETTIQTKSGLKKTLIVSTKKMKYQGADTYLSTYSDITEQQKVASALQKANKDLLVGERALKNMLYDLKKAHDEIKNAQSQLLQSERLAAIGQLAAGIAHEINNPMGFISSNLETLGQYISGYSQLLRATDILKKAVEEKNIERANAIIGEINSLEKKINLDFITSDIDNLIRESQSGIERIKKIILDLKTFSRQGKEAMEIVNIEEILEGIINIVWNEIKYKAELKKEYAGVPPLRCSPQKLGQVFINILINAAHAMKDKGVITVRTYLKGNNACIEFNDTGCGISKENMKKIFDPFFTTKPAGQGTGLGLSISYDIIKQHGGQIIATSEVNKGSQFTIILPLVSDVNSSS